MTQKTENAFEALEESTGVKRPKMVVEATARKRRYDAVRTALADEVKVADDNLAAARKATPLDDIEALVAHVEGAGNVADLDLGPDPVEVAQAVLKEKRRKLASGVAAQAKATADFVAAIRSPEAEKFLAACWARFAEPPKSSDTWAVVQSRSAVAESAFSIIGQLLISSAREAGAAKHEIAALRDTLKTRPLVMPTIASTRLRRKVEAESTGLAATARRQEAEKAAQRDRDWETAKEAAAARVGAALGGRPDPEDAAEVEA